MVHAEQDLDALIGSAHGVVLDRDPDLLREPAPPLGELLGRHESDDSVTPRGTWPSTARLQLGADSGGLLRHVADDLGVDPTSPADVLLCAVLSTQRSWARFVAEPGCPSPRDAGEWDLQSYR